MVLRVRVRGLTSVLKTVTDTQDQLKFKNISDLGKQFKEVIILGIRARNKGSAYHEYPSIHPGNLEKSVKVSYPGNGRLMASVHAPYAPIVEDGHKAINKYMAFIGKENQLVHTYHVRSTKPGKGFMRKAVSWLRRNAKKYFDTRVNRILKSKGKESGYGVLMVKR